MIGGLSIAQIWYPVLIAAIINSVGWVFSVFVVMVKHRTPAYHLTALYLLYFFFGFVLRPWTVLLDGHSGAWDIIGVVPSGDYVIWASIVSFIAHLTICAGFLWTRAGHRVPLFPQINFVVRKPIAFSAVLITYAGLGFYSTRAAVSGLNTVELDDHGAFRTTDISGYQTVFAEFLTVTLIVLFMVRRTRKASVIMIVSYTAFRMWYGSARSVYVAIVLSAALIALVNQKRRLPTFKVLAIGAALLIVFNIVGGDREGLRRVVDGRETSAELVSDYISGRAAQESTSVTQNMQEWDIFTSVLTHIPEETGYSFGSQYIGLILRPIPRFWWPNKPVVTTNFNLLDFGNYVNFTTSMFADTYECFGLVGLTVILFLISLYMSWSYSQVITNPTAMRCTFYFINISYSTLLFRDGPGSLIYYCLILVPAAFVLIRAGDITWELEPASTLPDVYRVDAGRRQFARS